MGIHHGAILRILRDDGPQSRAELARRTALSPTALTHLTAQLLKDGIVTELTQATGGGAPIGRPAVGLALVPDAHHVVGVHIGAGTIHAAVTDLKASVKQLDSFHFDTSTIEPARVIAKVARMVDALVRKTGADRSKILGMGLGVPGPVDIKRRRNLLSINYDWRDVAFADELEGALGMPVVVEHNVSAMALAESRYGIGREASALLYIYLRTGLGAGLVVDGRPFRPGGHGAVELGHIQVVEHGARCACGSTGCLETFLSERALSRAAGVDTPHPKRLLAAVEKHPEVWNDAVRHLTTAIASAANLLNPDLIVFGGHLGEAPESFIDAIRAGVPPRVLPPMRDTMRFERSSIGPGAGAIGGAAVALDHLFYSGAPR
ncbi:ROK family transcriptional regulator [Mesorhizobium sp. BH1-1-5]|uniref:ROK family transcriptional regulator n=1 Tax=Mesorhizobium sp. BH1-1-5 TaxID=2876661 RepID=UPI001CD0270F|nr:ROK family transcriptional regulator [Mesorhizobium sp. BH1-1-5]MBZ9986577.1 ROK family transcriptional regulator [Mesorhizobium sp. BH1-1-5]